MKDEVASLDFIYKDGRNEKSCNKEEITNVLSKGEKRALFILQFLFEIESRRVQEQQTFLVFDDIADSFDYKNKYAIIEYLKDLKEDSLFFSIILTHNFDFYRTISSRLGISRDCIFFAIRNDSEIHLQKGEYLKDVFANNFCRRVTEKKIFVSMIPFVRNIIEYTLGQSSNEYKLLTYCLHQKINSNTLLSSQIFQIMKDNIFACHDKEINFGNSTVISVILEEANSIADREIENESNLENKIVLSMGIRLLAEKYMIAKLGANIDLERITKDQTRALFDKYKEIIHDENLNVLDKVNLMTPENIHINAFMYEPLIDMSLQHLLDLYKQIQHLQGDYHA